MILGIDIGGTHTDAVVLDAKGVVKTAKVETNKANLLGSVLKVLDTVIDDYQNTAIKKINLSTTLTTNAIVEKRGEQVGLLIVPGPGIDPNHLLIGEDNWVLAGSIDHRGRVVAPIDETEIRKGISRFIKQGISHIAVVGKFSTRNNEHELAIEELVKENFPEVEQVVLGHRLSGNLNFPRRVATAYLSAKISSLHKQFVYAVQTALTERGIHAPVYLLKADGGTVELTNSLSNPVETALSGPAASIIGAVALTKKEGTGIVLDVGGTTTDLSILVDNVPLFQPKGAAIGDYKTLIRALYTKSIGLGGDSFIRLVNGELKIGPERMGPAACLGGTSPTPTDAFVVLGLANIGNKQLATEAFTDLATELKMGVEQVAETVLNQVNSIIIDHIHTTLEEFKGQPVYTIHELLTGFELRPNRLVGIGGPAHLMIPPVADKLGWQGEVPKDAMVANAVGAGCSRTTTLVSLRVDTAEGFVAIPQLGYWERLKGTSQITVSEAEAMAASWIEKKAENIGITPNDLVVEITDSQVFNVVDGFYTSGKIIDVIAQIKPGISNFFRLGE